MCRPGPRMGTAFFFQCLNRGKKSITLDLRRPEGREALHRLLPHMDVFFANPKGSMPDKMGLTYEHLQQFNSRLICCFLTGYGRCGPRMDHPGYDYLAPVPVGNCPGWEGEPDGPPARCGVSVIDMAAGTNAAFLIMVGVYRAQATGKGGDLDTSLFEIALTYQNYLNTWHLSSGWEPVKLPLGAHQTIVPSQLFRTSDGYLMVMAQQDKFFRALVVELGLGELADDPRFAGMPDRYRHREALLQILTEVFLSRKTKEWVALLEGKVPIAPVNSIPEALRDPQVEALGLVVEYEHPGLGLVRQTGPPFKVAGVPAGI